MKKDDIFSLEVRNQSLIEERVETVVEGGGLSDGGRGVAKQVVGLVQEVVEAVPRVTIVKAVDTMEWGVGEKEDVRVSERIDSKEYQ